MKALLIFAVGAFLAVKVAIGATGAAAPGVLAGPIVNPANGHSYYLLDASSWHAAEAQALTLGGHLATIRNADEDKWVYQTFGNYGGVPRDLWVGLSDEKSPGVWFWSSGESSTYTHWVPGEPNGVGGSEHWLQIINPGYPSGGGWNDQDENAGYKLYGVAEIGESLTPVGVNPTGIRVALNGNPNRPPPRGMVGSPSGVGAPGSPAPASPVPAAPAALAATPGVLAGPIVNPANGHTYYLFDASTWHAAEAKAVTMGGHLATIRDASEDRWVFQTFGYYGGVERNLWAGLSNDNPSNQWQWASGEPLGYTHWSNAQPDNAGGVEHWLQIFKPNYPGAGEWNDQNENAGFALFGVAEIAQSASNSRGGLEAIRALLNGSSNALPNPGARFTGPPAGPAPAVAPAPTAKPGVLAGPIVNPANSHAYYLVGPGSWHDIETKASAMGGHLATIRDAAEDQWVYSTFGNYGGVPRNYWIGLSDEAQTNAYRWASGEITGGYYNWAPGEPNHTDGKEHWVQVIAPNDSAGRAGKWNDDLDKSLYTFYGVVELPTPPAQHGPGLAAPTVLGVGLGVGPATGRARGGPASDPSHPPAGASGTTLSIAPSPGAAIWAWLAANGKWVAAIMACAAVGALLLFSRETIVRLPDPSGRFTAVVSRWRYERFIAKAGEPGEDEPVYVEIFGPGGDSFGRVRVDNLKAAQGVQWREMGAEISGVAAWDFAHRRFHAWKRT